jgi:hypothetical protein
MLDIDFRAVWTMGKGEFSLWFVPAGLLTNLLYIRKSLKLSWAKSCSADLHNDGDIVAGNGGSAPMVGPVGRSPYVAA